MSAYSMVDNDETIVCHHMDTSDEKAQMAPLAHADRIVFQTELYCFAQDDIMGYRQKGKSKKEFARQHSPALRKKWRSSALPSP